VDDDDDDDDDDEIADYGDRAVWVAWSQIRFERSNRCSVYLSWYGHVALFLKSCVFVCKCGLRPGFVVAHLRNYFNCQRVVSDLVICPRTQNSLISANRMDNNNNNNNNNDNTHSVCVGFSWLPGYSCLEECRFIAWHHNSLIDKYQHMHFFTFNTVLV